MRIAKRKNPCHRTGLEGRLHHGIEMVIEALERRLNKKLKEIKNKMATEQELQAVATELSNKITAVQDGLTDFKGDFKAAVDKLTSEQGNGNVSDETVAAFAALVNKLDEPLATIKELDEKAETISGVPTPPTTPEAA